ncbi:MAG: acyltransferase [Rhizobiales bacterium]|nr:acyltransferase [Hyphomicrobiales bacterium]
MQLSYRREIDGLRAIAVLAVIFFHARFPFFGGGFVGVDVFFVISGYLITSILLADLESDRFSLLGFYERRARRILPALFCVLAVTVMIAPFFLLPRELADFSESVTHVILFLSNVYFYNNTGYFDTAAELVPLLHTWSLAVEEQYYIVFPLVLALIWRKSRALIFPVLLATAAASLAYSAYKVETNVDAAFFLTPSRIWELLVGALVASHGHRLRVPLPAAQAGSLGGAGLVLYSIFFFDDNTPFPGVHALAPVTGTALVIQCASPATWIGRVLATSPLVGMGLISYSAYLWHQPLFAFARQESIAEPSIAVFAGLIIATLGIAYLSWRFVERPFRDKQRIGRRNVFVLSGTGMGLFLAFGLFGTHSGFFTELYKAKLDQRQLSILEDRVPGVSPERKDCQQAHTRISSEFVERFETCFRKYGKGLIVLGDSHGIDMYNAMKSLAGQPFVFGVARAGCRPHSPPKKGSCPFDDFRDFLSKHGEAVSEVIYTQAGFYLAVGSHGVSGNRDIFKLRSVPVYQPNAAFIDRVIAFLDSLRPYARVVWIGPRIEPHLNALRMKRLAMDCAISPLDVQDNIETTFRQLDTFIKSRASADSNITYVSGIDAVGFDESRDLYDCNSVYWSDGDHWSTAGEIRFGARIYKTLVARGLL